LKLLPAFTDERVAMFDSQNPMTALGLMYALRLSKEQQHARRPKVASVSWFTRLTRAVTEAFAPRPVTQQPAPAMKLPTPVKPDLQSKRAA
jgi:hypothetical protein